MMLSDACLIHAARHPADTALSCYAQPFEGRGTPWASNLTSECVSGHALALPRRQGHRAFGRAVFGGLVCGGWCLVGGASPCLTKLPSPACPWLPRLAPACLAAPQASRTRCSWCSS